MFSEQRLCWLSLESIENTNSSEVITVAPHTAEGVQQWAQKTIEESLDWLHANSFGDTEELITELANGVIKKESVQRLLALSLEGIEQNNEPMSLQQLVSYVHLHKAELLAHNDSGALRNRHELHMEIPNLATAINSVGIIENKNGNSSMCTTVTEEGWILVEKSIITNNKGEIDFSGLSIRFSDQQHPITLRDLKPETCIKNDKGEFCILDPGLTKTIDRSFIPAAKTYDPNKLFALQVSKDGNAGIPLQALLGERNAIEDNYGAQMSQWEGQGNMLYNSIGAMPIVNHKGELVTIMDPAATASSGGLRTGITMSEQRVQESISGVGGVRTEIT